jgi:hypothetical protein
VWGSGAITPDLGLAILAQNPVLLNTTAAIALICAPVLALVPNATSCVPTALLLDTQALVLAQTLESARLCGNNARANFMPATNTHECVCPPGQRCEPVHPSQMAFDVTMIVFAFIALLIVGAMLAPPSSAAQKALE